MMNIRRGVGRRLTLSALLLCFSSTGSPVASADYVFSKAANTDTVPPNAAGHFTGFASDYAVEGNQVIFAGGTSDQPQKVYLYDRGNLTVLVDGNVAIPEGTGGFSGSYEIGNLQGGSFPFTAWGSSSQHGVYLFINGTILKIADKNIVAPNTTQFFRAFELPSMDGTRVLFKGVTEEGR